MLEVLARLNFVLLNLSLPAKHVFEVWRSPMTNSLKVFWHIGDHNFSPYRSTVTVLRRCENADEPTLANEILLQASPSLYIGLSLA